MVQPHDAIVLPHFLTFLLADKSCARTRGTDANMAPALTIATTSMLPSRRPIFRLERRLDEWKKTRLDAAVSPILFSEPIFPPSNGADDGGLVYSART
jgi:hypothetical protein